MPRLVLLPEFCSHNFPYVDTHIFNSTRRPWRERMFRVCLLGSTLWCLVATPAFGQCGTTWVGPANGGQWSNGSYWSHGVPTASTNVCIDNGNSQHSAVTLDIAGAQADNLAINSDDSLSFNNATSLTINGTSIANAGNITLNSAGNLTDLILAGSNKVTLSGGGTVTLGNNPENRIYSASNGTLVNQETIQGAGQIGVNQTTITNSGTIDANVSNTLVVQPGSGGATNTGTLEATNGGTLDLRGSYTNTGGIINATGALSVVALDGATISGGTLTTSTGGVIKSLNTAALNGVTISAGSTYTLPNDTNTVLQGTITNNGIIAQNSAGNLTDLILAGSNAVTLSGSGTVTLGNNPENRIYSANNGTLVNQETIQGAGQIGVNQTTITNSGTIDANVSNTLVIQPGSGGATNTGTLEASSGGTLQLIGGYTNTGGTIQALTASTVELNNAAISNGTLTTAGTGVFESLNSATLSAVTISAGSTYTLPNNTNTALKGLITNNGVIALNSVGNLTNLQISGSVTLAGPGSVNMGNNPENRMYGLTGSDTLTNQQTIQGGGQLGVGLLAIVNQKIIDANLATTTLLIQPNPSVTNTGTIEATGGGTLELEGTYNNSGGTILALTGSLAELNAPTINGGTLTTSGSGLIESVSSAILNGVTLSAGSNYALPNNTTTGLQGTITNNGTIQLNSAGNLTDLQVSGSVTLTGTGSVNMGNNFFNRIYAPNGTDTLTIKQTIQGVGQVGFNLTALVNQGTIDANFAGSVLLVQPNGSGLTNSGGVLQATNGAILQLTGNFNNASGTIEALNASTASLVNLSGAAITGGTLTTTGNGLIEDVNTASLNGVTISSGSNYSLLNNTVTALQGTITNNGNLQLNSVGNLTDLQMVGPVTLAGSGVLTMSNNAENRIYAKNGLDTLTIQQTIQGAGQLGAGMITLVNQGIIDANVSTPLTIQANSTTQVTNTGTIEASGGGTLDLKGLYINTGGTIEALTASTAELDTVTVKGGTLTTTGSGVMDVVNTAALNGVTVSKGSTLTLLNNTATALVGTITNNGTIKQNSGGNLTDLQISGPVTLQGAGILMMSNNPENRIYALNGTDVLTNKETIEGSGQLGVGMMGLINNGTILANQSNALLVDLSSSGFTNNGTLQVNTGDVMHVFGGPFTNFSGTTLTGGSYVVTGTLEIDQLGNNGGEIVTDAAKITLGGTHASFIDAGSKNVLSNLATISPTGAFTLSGSSNFMTAGSFTNNGALTVGSGSTFDVHGNLTNFSKTTLTGGTYAITGTLQFNGANIVNNDAKIALSGVNSKIVDQTGANGLANFANNATAGTITLAGNRTFTTAGRFTDAGALKVSKGSSFTVGANGSYTETGGSTTVDGTLTTTGSGKINITSGSVFGNGGTFNGNVISDGTFNVGDAIKRAGRLAITGSYTQSSGGILPIDIGGTTAGTLYDQLNISGAATLGGTLNLDLINNFTPTLGTTFDIMNFSGKAGTFATINGTQINQSEHFSVSVNSTNVMLDVVSGSVSSGPIFGDGQGSLGLLNLVGSAGPGNAAGVSATPEPSTLLLVGSGLLGGVMFHRRRRRISLFGKRN